MAGGTWLFSEPQPHLRKLVDLLAMSWQPLVISPQGLEIAATCTIAELEAAALPESWAAAPLFGQCCRALLASFKIWNTATVGGNICLSLPAGSMISLATALDGVGTIWMPNGQERELRILDLITGPNGNALVQGEVLRSISITSEALTRQTAFRQISLTPHGRSGALLIGTRSKGGFTLTVTASTPRPVQLRFVALPAAAELAARLETAVPAASYYDDMHGRPDWRRHVTLLYAEEIRQELGAVS